jgi:hypothetical protein
MSKLTKIAAVIAVLGFTTLSASSFADTRWEHNHPRRDQVNDRLENQNRRINHEVAEGEISRGQAARLHAADHRIRQEERFMAAHHDGHITRYEQSLLNRQENRISRRIGV